MRFFLLLLSVLCLPAIASTKYAASLKNWGLINSNAQSHIDAVPAWHITEGSDKVVVAVIDTGIDFNHPALERNINYSGWNFVADNANPNDFDSHGTNIAGIIGATFDRVTGVSGVAHKVSLMPIKYYSDTAPNKVNVLNTVKSIEYAVTKNVQIINYSSGGPTFSEDEYLALKKTEEHEILFVSSAGNEREDIDLPENRFYPASYRLSNMISVAATDINNNLLRHSNYGETTVDIAAPGENIYSTLPGGKYGYMSGTSQATAFVTGVAVLLLSKCQGLKPYDARSILMASADRFPQLTHKVVSGRLNAYKALLELDRRARLNPALCTKAAQ
jgi:thermitase